MPLPLLRTAEPSASPLSRLRADARFAAPCHVMAGRASETAEQSDDWLAACVRSLNDESDGFGLEPEQIAALHKPDPQIAIRHVPPFAEPGEMAMRERDEVSQDTGTRPIGIVMSLLLVACFGATLVGAAEAYPFVARWFQ